MCCTTKTPSVTFKNQLPLEIKDCWQFLDIEKDTIAGSSQFRAHKDLIKGKTMSAYPELVKDAFLYAQKHNVLLVAGAGNDSSDNDIKPFYPIDYNEKTGAEFCNNFIKVGAITMDGDSNFLAPFTNYGKKTVDIFAPGYFLKTTDAQGGYSYRDGTSMASPIVCGVAALVWSYFPKLSASQIKQIILDSGVSYDLQVQVPNEKNGVTKSFKEMSKSGKVVNVYNALLMAENLRKK